VIISAYGFVPTWATTPAHNKNMNRAQSPAAIAFSTNAHSGKTLLCGAPAHVVRCRLAFLFPIRTSRCKQLGDSLATAQSVHCS
jgi:hypothetical protein